MIVFVFITLTGIVLCCHCGALIVIHAYSNNRDVVGASRLEFVQPEPVGSNQKGSVDAGHTEVILIMVHVLWKGPGEVDGLHSLKVHHDGAGRVGN